MARDISEQLYRDMSRKAEASLSSVLMLQQKILQWLKERREQEAAIRNGLGEASFANLCKSIDRAHDEQIAYCEVPTRVYEDMCKTGLIQNGALRTYTAMQSANSDNVMIFYGSKDQAGMNNILNAMDAMYGKRSVIDTKSFEMLSEGKDLYVLEGLSAADAELLSHFAAMAANTDNQLEGFPFTVIEQNKKGANSLAIVCLDEDKRKLANLMGLVAATFVSTQGPRVLEQVEYKIKGRQERNIAVTEAKKEQAIIDAANPRVMLHVTATDYEFYKNNKAVESIPRSGPLNRVYDIIEGMSEATLIDPKKIAGLSEAEQQEVIHKEGKSIESVNKMPIDVDLEESMHQMEYEDSVKQYLRKMTGVTVKADSRDIGAVVKQVEKEQRRRGERDAETHQFDNEPSL